MKQSEERGHPEQGGGESRGKVSDDEEAPTLPSTRGVPPLSTAAQTPVLKSHTLTTACLPSCTLAMTEPSWSKPKAHTCAVWPTKYRWRGGAAAEGGDSEGGHRMATMTEAAVKTASSELGAHCSALVNSPVKALTRERRMPGGGRSDSGAGCDDDSRRMGG